jgi:tRNA pseudouridine55 synthase
MTSHDVVTLARRALQTRRIGHTGTLDPFATGLLVLLVGRATRLAQFVEDEPKIYEATIRFGAETTTDDPTGEVTRVSEVPRPEAVDRAIESLTGRIAQRPPAFSAKKVGGRRAYAAARAGAPLDLEPVPVVVHEWLVRSRTSESLDVTISCGAGTYIRALARDLGRAAGSAAHVTALRRVRSGTFDVRHALRPEDLAERSEQALAPVRSAVHHLPVQSLGIMDRRRVENGSVIDARIDGPLVALIGEDGELVAIAERIGENLQPRVVMHEG